MCEVSDEVVQVSIGKRPVDPPITLGGLSISNGVGNDYILLTNLSTRGSVTIANGDGESRTLLGGAAAGRSAILGSLSVTNGMGNDFVQLLDQDVAGNVTISNGRPDDYNGVAGGVRFANLYHTDRRSVVGGREIRTQRQFSLSRCWLITFAFTNARRPQMCRLCLPTRARTGRWRSTL